MTTNTTQQTVEPTDTVNEQQTVNQLREVARFIEKLEDTWTEINVTRKGTYGDNPVIETQSLPDGHVLQLPEDYDEDIPNKPVVKTILDGNNTDTLILPAKISSLLSIKQINKLSNSIIGNSTGDTLRAYAHISAGVISLTTAVITFEFLIYSDFEFIISMFIITLGLGIGLSASILIFVEELTKTGPHECEIIDVNEHDVSWDNETTNHEPVEIEVSEAELTTENEHLTITTTLNGQETTWNVNPANHSIIPDPYRTILNRHDPETAVIQTRKHNEQTEVTDDEALSQCGDWVLQPT